jgi:hypothetical protein
MQTTHKIRRNEFGLLIHFAVINMMLLFASFTGIVGPSWFTILTMFGIVNISLLIAKVAPLRLKSILFDKEQNKVTLELDRWFFIKKIIDTSAEDVKIVVKREHYARSTFASYLNVYLKDQLVVKMTLGFSGWREETLLYFAQNLKQDP